jgi:hypothetical protein
MSKNQKIVESHIVFTSLIHDSAPAAEELLASAQGWVKVWDLFVPDRGGIRRTARLSKSRGAPGCEASAPHLVGAS